jgi:hypothetical protein
MPREGTRKRADVTRVLLLAPLRREAAGKRTLDRELRTVLCQE